MSIQEVYPNELIEKVAEELKKITAIKPPAWAAFVKTGASKERPPFEADWWYKRVAAILRSVCVLGPVGVSKLRTKYGGKQRRGHSPPRFKRGSGNIIRKALQQLEKAGLIKFVEKGVHKGRVATPKGKSLLDKTAIAILKTKPKRAVKKHAPKAEEKKVEAPKEQKAEKKAEAPKEKKIEEKKVEAPKEQKAEKKAEAPKEKKIEEKKAEPKKEEEKAAEAEK